MNRNRLYILLSLGLTAGYVWLYKNYGLSAEESKETYGCLLKHVTNVPCPSCGSTRSVVSLLHGNLAEALYWNPLGIFLVLILAITPFWLAYDFFTRKSSLYFFYRKLELLLIRKQVAIPLIALVLVNWAWNIYKGN